MPGVGNSRQAKSRSAIPALAGIHGPVDLRSWRKAVSPRLNHGWTQGFMGHYPDIGKPRRTGDPSRETRTHPRRQLAGGQKHTNRSPLIARPVRVGASLQLSLARSALSPRRAEKGVTDRRRQCRSRTPARSFPMPPFMRI